MKEPWQDALLRAQDYMYALQFCIEYFARNFSSCIVTNMWMFCKQAYTIRNIKALKVVDKVKLKH